MEDEKKDVVVEAKVDEKPVEAKVEEKPAEAKVETKEAPAALPKSEEKTDNRENNNRRNNNASQGGRPQRGGGNPKFQRRQSEFEERVISIRRVVKVVKGGRRFRFSALVVIGNKKGQVGYGIGKSQEVPDAIKKAIKDAKKNLIRVNIIKGADTVPCEWISKHNASKVMIKPAKEGTGIIASDSVRSVLELAGIRNVYTKSLGSNTPQNVIKATAKALSEMLTEEEVKRLRDKSEL